MPDPTPRLVEPGADPLLDLAFVALDHGVDSVIASGGPLVPFVLTQNPAGERALQRFVADTLEESVARAFELLDRCSGLDLAAVAYDGYVHLDGARTDAVLVEARGPQGRVITLAQRSRSAACSARGCTASATRHC